MSDKVLIPENSRYIDTELLKDSVSSNLYFGLWETPLNAEDFSDTLSNIEHVIVSTEIGCLDILAWNYFDDERLGWIIAWFNGIIDPIEEMVEGEILIIPNPAKVSQLWAKK